jgi:uncharacterized protein
VPEENNKISHRQIWAANRSWQETRKSNFKLSKSKYGVSSKTFSDFFINKSLSLFFKLTGLYNRGKQNARQLVYQEIPLSFKNLPDDFDNFSILHLSDIHLHHDSGMERLVIDTIGHRKYDLCIITGDCRKSQRDSILPTINGLQFLVKRIKTKHGFLAVLGNHDSCFMVNPMEKMGIRVLTNESILLHQGSAQIKITGTDDVHSYYTDQAVYAFEPPTNHFSIALVHSPELYDTAAMAGTNLYLCGHTHSGQLCLPGGTALKKNISRGRVYYKGLWSHNGMQGVTSAGIGTSGLPLRFNCPPEILNIRLTKCS